MSKLKLPGTIKMVITDFDGIMTDGCVYINENSVISRKISFKDVMGLHILRQNNIQVSIISGESSSAIDMLAKRFAVEDVHQNIRVKIDTVKSVLEKYGLSDEEFVYIGDDINDFEPLNFAKYRITVPNAADKVKKIKGIQMTKSCGGNGAFREVADCLADLKK
ncbi:MAG: HAD hydrolase family protein [Heliobacteriaceae bacterium]|nr:HAD hydrolase family protein [Heliobacteriaceae bacterium]